MSRHLWVMDLTSRGYQVDEIEDLQMMQITILRLCGGTLTIYHASPKQLRPCPLVEDVHCNEGSILHDVFHISILSTK